MNSKIPTKNGIGRQCFLVDAGVLQLVRNILQRSAERGNNNHGEVLDELTKATFQLPEGIRSLLAESDSQITTIHPEGKDPVLTLDVDFSGHSVEYRIACLHPGIEELNHGKYQLYTK